ncbi:MAG: hypothetical protein PWP45_594 [Tepidanaerobacteraceae bacterium]|nr:hypothetical protein [Tepidanaerobacteraceae bacterium]
MIKLGDFKQEVMKINNRVNEEMYGRGLDWQKVEIFGDKIIIIALNRRISILKHLDNKDNFTARLMDLALLNEFKVRFKKNFEESTGLGIRSILKDYDPVNQLAGTIIITVEPVEEFLSRKNLEEKNNSPY